VPDQPHNRRLTDRVPGADESFGSSGGDGGERRAPDPTALTTAHLLREIALLTARMDTRMGGMDALNGERFARIEHWLDLVEKHRQEQKLDTQTAVAAALQAQKESVNQQTIASERSISKSEAATSKQIEQLSTTFNTAITGVTDSLGDLKDRVGRIEAIKAGATQAYTGLSVAIVTAGAIIAAVVGIAVTR
jgi:hypothetical protein